MSEKPSDAAHRQLLIEHILRLLGMFENDTTGLPGTPLAPAKTRAISRMSSQATRCFAEDRGLTGFCGRLTWVVPRDR